MRHSVTALLMLATSPLAAENYLHHSSDSRDDWGLSLNAEGYRWEMEGSFANVGKLTTNVASSFSGTGESLGLGEETVGQFTLIASNRRWNIGAYSLKLDYQGEGSGLSGVIVSNLAAFAVSDVTSSVLLDFLVAELTYNIISTEDSLLGVGFAAGKLDMDVNFNVDNADRFSYQRNDPYGYLILNVQNRLDRFFYG